MSQTLERALRILDFVAKEPRRIGEIAAFLGVHHSTALRLLQSLRKQKFVFELPDHSYRLGAATFRIGFQALEGLDLRHVARPFMENLGASTGETIHLATLEGGDVLYIDKVEARHAVRMYSRIGSVAPLHCAAVSKAIMAFLPDADRERILRDRVFDRRTEHSLTTREALEQNFAEARARGYVLDAEENEPGIHCIGMPLFNGARQVAGSLSVSTPMSRVDRLDSSASLQPCRRPCRGFRASWAGCRPNVVPRPHARPVRIVGLMRQPPNRRAAPLSSDAHPPQKRLHPACGRHVARQNRQQTRHPFGHGS